MSEQDKASRERASASDPTSPRFHQPGPTSRPPHPSDTSSSTTTTPHTHSHSHSYSTPHHHHHHHHHHHRHHSMSHPSVGGGGGGGSGAAGSDRPSGSAGPSSAHEASRVPGSGLSSAYPSLASSSSASSGPRPSGAYGASGQTSYLGNYMAEKRERERVRQMDRERASDRERERDGRGPPPPPLQHKSGVSGGAGAPETSPGRSPVYPRPMMSPSPTLPNRPPNSGGPPPSSNASKPSNAPQAPSSSSSRGVPLPSFSSLGGRPLGAPFEHGRERSGSVSSAGGPPEKGPSHQRNLSTSSNPRESLGAMSSMGQTSPVKSSLPPPSASRSLFGPPPLSTASRDTPPQRSPVQTTGSAATSPKQQSREAGAPGAPGKPGGPSSSATSQSARPPYSFSSTYASAYTQPYSSYGLGSGFMSGNSPGYGFTYSAQERERREREQREQREKDQRARDGERERERERERLERDRREREMERERAERERRERDLERERADRDRREREIERERAAMAERERKFALEREDRHREERMRFDKERERRASYGVQTKPFQPPRQESSTYPDMHRARPPPSSTPNPPGYGDKYTTHIEVINRPSEQPPADRSRPTPPTSAGPPPAQPPTSGGPQSARDRPYSYKPQEVREYQYTPRDNKRPRMDTVVDEPAPAPAPAPAPTTTQRGKGSGGRAKKRKEEEKKEPARDYSQLTAAVKTWPEVKSTAIEAWLKSQPTALTQRTVGHEVYRGPDWSLAKTRLTDDEALGGVVKVRISGAFLGSGWRVRGEAEWDNANVTPSTDAAISLHGVNSGESERRIWGTDVYTDDSDLGLILIHAGWIRWNPTAGPDDNDAITVTVRVVPTLLRYTATERNGIVTRNWGSSHEGSSIVIEGVERVKVGKVPLQVSRRTRRKLDMAERALQYVALQHFAPAPEDLESAAGVLAEDRFDVPKDKFWPDRSSAQMQVMLGNMLSMYSSDAMAGWLAPPGDGDPHASVWTHTLWLVTDTAKYMLSIKGPKCDQPLITFFSAEGLKHPFNYKDDDRRLNIQWHDLDPRQIHFVDEGVVVHHGPDDAASLYKVKLYGWEPLEQPITASYLDDDIAEAEGDAAAAASTNGVAAKDVADTKPVLDDAGARASDAMDVDPPTPVTAAS